MLTIFSPTRRSGFTLIELLIVIGIIGTLASVTIVAINPNKQLLSAKDAARLNMVRALQNALSQYSIDNGSFPAGVPTVTTKPLCKQGVTGDATCVNLDTALVPTYIAQIPQDSAETRANYSGYMVLINKGRPEVTASYLGLSNGLVGYWKFSEGAGTATADSSENGNNGTIGSGPTWTTAGKYGNALLFNGFTNNVVVPNSASLNSGTISVMAWVKGSVTPYWQEIVGKGSPDDYSLWLSPSSGICYGESYINGVAQQIIGGPSLMDNSWHHCAYVYDGSTQKIYVDGVLQSTNSHPGTLSITTNPISIGAEYGSYNFSILDDVRIYNRAVTATEMQQIVAGNG